MQIDVATLILVPLAAVVAVLLATAVSSLVRIPLVVFEIVLGILIGPAVLGWAKEIDFLSNLSDLGLVMLFFLAGFEIDFARISGRPLRRAGLGWLLSIGLALLAGLALAPHPVDAVYVGVALASTSLGTIMPVLRDAGELPTPFGRAVTAVGAAGEFGPLLAISLFLSGRRPGTATVVLVGFGVVALLAIWLAARGHHPRLHRLIDATIHSSGQFAVRLVVLLMAALAGLSLWLGIDMLLGAFAAGVVFRILLAGVDPDVRELIDTKLEAVGFGLLVPIFFINTGITFQLDELLDDTSALLLLPVWVVLLLVVRGGPGMLAAPPGSSGADRRAVALFSATALPIIVAVTAIGTAPRAGRGHGRVAGRGGDGLGAGVPPAGAGPAPAQRSTDLGPGLVTGQARPLAWVHQTVVWLTLTGGINPARHPCTVGAAMSVKDLKFVITGAAKGIGAATARVAAADGAKVVLSDLDDDGGEALVEEIRSAGGQAWYVHADVSDDAQLDSLMKSAAESMDGIDVLHNNAGIHDTMLTTDLSLGAFPRAAWDKVIAVNLTAPLFAAKAAFPYLKESSNASIINAGSTGSWVGYPAGLAYGSSKGGIALLTKALAVDLAPYAIRVNCYCPAAVKTQMVDIYFDAAPDKEALLRSLTETHLVHRLGDPVDVANLVCFLASDKASFVNGVLWLIDGGSLAWRGTVDVLGM